VGALDANTPIPNVLRTKPDDLAAPRCGLERKFHDQPLLRPERPMGAVLRDLLIGPSVMTLSLGHLNAGDAFGRIVPAHGRHGRLQ
jgi:hypothetical protein